MTPRYRAGWLLCRALFRCFFRWRVFHADRVPAHGPVILASNHASYLDPPLVGAGVSRNCVFLARETLLRNWFLRWLLPAWGVVPLDRDRGTASGLKTVLDKLAQGHAVVLFPEGTRSPDGRLQRGRPGIGFIVIHSTAPLVPVRIFGSFEAWPRQARFPRPHRIVIKFGQPLLFQQSRAEAPTASPARLKEIYQVVSDEIMAAIGALEPRSD